MLLQVKYWTPQVHVIVFDKDVSCADDDYYDKERKQQRCVCPCLFLILLPLLLGFNGNFDGNKVIQLWNLTFLVPIQCIFLNGGIFHFSSSPSTCCGSSPLHRQPPFMKFFSCTSSQWADEIFFIVLPREMIPTIEGYLHIGYRWTVGTQCDVQ